MDAAARVVNRAEDRRGEGAPLRLRRAPVGDPVDSVVETFLGGEGKASRDDAVDAPASSGCGDAGCGVCEPVAEFKPLRLRCPRAASVVIGVEPSGRVCLEVQVGAGVGVSKVLSELEEAERWLRSSAHESGVAPMAGRMDMSYPVRRRVVVESGEVAAGTLARAGLEVRGRVR